MRRKIKSISEFVDVAIDHAYNNIEFFLKTTNSNDFAQYLTELAINNDFNFDIRDFYNSENDSDTYMFFNKYLNTHADAVNKFKEVVKYQKRELKDYKRSRRNNLNKQFFSLVRSSTSDFHIIEQEPGVIDLYTKEDDGLHLFEYGFTSVEDAARYACVILGERNIKLFPQTKPGPRMSVKRPGTSIMLDANAIEALKELLDAGYNIEPDSQGHSFKIFEPSQTVNEIIKKYRLTEFKRDVDKYDIHSCYDGDIVDYIDKNTTYDLHSVNRNKSDIGTILKNAHISRLQDIDYKSSNDLQFNSIYEEMNNIDDDSSLN